MIRRIASIAVVLSAALVPLLASAQWSAPTQSPPNGNASAPINTSSTSQTKSGTLIVGSLGSSGGGYLLGNFGVGTASPGSKLTISGTAAESVVFDADSDQFSGRNARFPGRFMIGPLASGYPQIGYNFSTANSTYTKIANDTAWRITFGVSNRMDFSYAAAGTGTFSWSDFMTILNSGNVGIGTTGPSQKLHVNGNIRVADDADIFGLDQVVGYNDLRFYTDNTGTTERARLWNTGGLSLGTIADPGAANLAVSGNIGVGTTGATAKLQVNSDNSAAITGTSPTGALALRGATASLTAGVESASPYYGWLQMRNSTASGSTYPLSLQPLGGNVGIGVTNPGYSLDVNGALRGTAFYYSSDRRLKDDVQPLEGALSKVLSLEGVSFNWKKDGKEDIGLIAQDVEKVYPEIVSTDSSSGYKSVEYGNLVAPLIEAIKEQQKQIDALKAEVAALKANQ